MKHYSRHTQGPWTFLLSANGDTLNLVNIREMPMKNGTIEETVLSINKGAIPVDANRRLIAAAPEMLEALERITKLIETDNLIEQHGRLMGSYLEACQAIEKARGKS